MAAPTAASSATSAAAKATGLSKGGQAFFGGLCAATFGLGCWQVQRLVEKWSLIEEREKELAMDPTTKWSSSKHPYRRRVVQGEFRYDKEVLVGPRGAPPGVKLPRKGLSKGKSNQSGGMAPGPQGYHVLTPLQVPVKSPDGTHKSNRLLWVNRGWVPKTMVPDARRGLQETNSNMLDWTRPKGKVTVVAVRSELEKPKLIKPEHDYSKQPLQLFWLDGIALKAISEEPQEDETIYLTQVTNQSSDASDDGDDTQQLVQYPLVPPVKSMAEFKTTPMIHIGYATTWYGLSAAGVYMTRKLITRGRG